MGASLSDYMLTSQHGRLGKYNLATTVEYRVYKVLHTKVQIVGNLALIHKTEHKMSFIAPKQEGLFPTQSQYTHLRYTADKYPTYL